MSLDENKTVMRRFMDEVWHAGDRAAAEAVIAPDVVVHGTVPDQPPGPEGQLVAGAIFRAAFPDARWTIEELIAEGDRVVSRWSMTGTHAGPLFDLPATGRAIAWTGIDIIRVADGQVAEIWHNEDFYGLMRQLGAVS